MNRFVELVVTFPPHQM